MLLELTNLLVAATGSNTLTTTATTKFYFNGNPGGKLLLATKCY